VFPGIAVIVYAVYTASLLHFAAKTKHSQVLFQTDNNNNNNYNNLHLSQVEAINSEIFDIVIVVFL